MYLKKGDGNVLFFMQQSIFFGSMLCFVILLRNFAGRGISSKTWFDATVLAAGGVLLFYAWCNIAEVFSPVELLNHLYVPFIFMMGPATYVGFFLSVDAEFKFKRQHLLYFAPGAILLVVLPFLAVINPPLFAHHPMDFFKGEPPTLLEYLVVGGFSINLFYYMPIFRRTSLLFNFQSLKTQLAPRILIGIYVVTTGITALIIAAFAVRNSFWLYLAATLTAYLTVLVHIFRRFSPELFEQIQVAIEKGRVSRLEGIDQKQLHFDLIDLMMSEKLYMDETLTVAKLAEELDIKPHQLSEFLNTYMGMNFNRFINHLRIEKAVKVLLENPSANVLDVAFECGFNSKAAFNAAFSSLKGMPPGKYVQEKRRSLPVESPES